MSDFKKPIITKLTELNKIPIAERSKYYLADDLVATVGGFIRNDEPLIPVLSENHSFWVAPFWQDEPVVTPDPELQQLLDKEGDYFRKYIQQHPDFSFLLRATVVAKLEQIQNQLPSHLRLVLKAGYRPLEVQKWLFEDNLQYLRQKFPHYTEAEIYHLNLEFVADPENFIPPHATGGAVDLLLWDTRTEKPLDMGSPINYPDDLSWTWNMTNLTKEQRHNRIFLTELMTSNDFANLASEWWHYSYGDQYWALFFGEPNCWYNLCSDWHVQSHLIEN